MVQEGDTKRIFTQLLDYSATANILMACEQTTEDEADNLSLDKVKAAEWGISTILDRQLVSIWRSQPLLIWLSVKTRHLSQCNSGFSM